jgi:hypothetical protein
MSISGVLGAKEEYQEKWETMEAEIEKLKKKLKFVQDMNM